MGRGFVKGMDRSGVAHVIGCAWQRSSRKLSAVAVVLIMAIAGMLAVLPLDAEQQSGGVFGRIVYGDVSPLS